MPWSKFQRFSFSRFFVFLLVDRYHNSCLDTLHHAYRSAFDEKGNKRGKKMIKSRKLGRFSIECRPSKVRLNP